MNQIDPIQYQIYLNPQDQDFCLYQDQIILTFFILIYELLSEKWTSCSVQESENKILNHQKSTGFILGRKPSAVLVSWKSVVVFLCNPADKPTKVTSNTVNLLFKIKRTSKGISRSLSIYFVSQFLSSFWKCGRVSAKKEAFPQPYLEDLHLAFQR